MNTILPTTLITLFFTRLKQLFSKNKEKKQPSNYTEKEEEPRTYLPIHLM